jgi:dihydrofolate synthase / folylpolyglutamate synthase
VTESWEALRERLYGLAPRGAELGLARMQAACALFGHPEQRLSAIHVAGTNGKGSVCAMVAAMAKASGRRVGLYTSPHLCRFNERIQVAGADVDHDVLAPSLSAVLERAPDLTFFEASTLTALVAFAELSVDLAVVEVGLGGRLDATNVLVRPRATAITRIALDHTDRLGHDLASIAREKAGIIKPGAPLVLGPLAPEAALVVGDIARRANVVPIVALGSDRIRAIVDRSPPALPGAHQIENAAVAAALAEIAEIDERAIADGLARVRWPGRLETIASPGGEVLLDSAHNPDGAAALAKELRGRGRPPSSVALVFGTMADKNWAEMLALLAPAATHRVYVAPEGRKPTDPAEMAAAVGGDAAATVELGLSLARGMVGPAGLVVVAGSIFLVGAARARLLGLGRDPPVAL